MSDIEIKKSTTARGFNLVNFKDAYGVECSIQESSSAEEPKIWFGIDSPKVMRLDNGWKDITPVSTKENPVNIDSRMHLTREHVKQLLPILRHFVKTGEVGR